LTQTLENAGEAIAGGAMSDDGRRAVTGGYGSGITLWDLEDMKSLGKRYGHKKRVWAFDFAPDGGRFATGSDDQTVRIWEFSSQKTIRTIELDAPVRCVRFSPEGTSLVTATADPQGWQFPGRLQLWSIASGKLLTELRGHEVAVNAAVFSPDGKELTSCDANGMVSRWNAITGEQLESLSHPFGLSHAGIVGSRDLIAMRRFSNGILLFKSGTLTPVSEFDVPTRSIGDLNVASRGNRIIAGTEEGSVFVWSLDNE
jgi:WD40 repeat protein